MNPATSSVSIAAQIVDAMDACIDSLPTSFSALRKSENGYTSLTLEELRQLIEHAVAHASSQEPLSIQLLRYMPVTAIGDIGIAAMTADTLGDALDTGIRYCPLAFPVFDFHKSVSGNTVRVDMRPRYDLGPVCNAVLVELQAGMFVQMAFFARHAPQRERAARYVMRVGFTHEAQGGLAAYKAFFGDTPGFKQSGSYFSLGRHVLRQRLLTSNWTNYRSLTGDLERRLQKLNALERAADRVQGLIWKSLMDGERLSAPQIAEKLFMSVRTLGRRLEEEGTSTRHLIEQTRLEFARNLAESTDLPINLIASKVGYSSSSAFSRAFRRHYGVTPRFIKS